MLTHVLALLWGTLRGSYAGRQWLWHLLAAALTFVLVVSGLDWWFFEHTRGEQWYWLVMTAGIGGFFVPVVVPVAAYAWAHLRGRARLRLAGAAVLAAELAAWLVSSTYKAFTGRVEPEFLTHFSTTDTSTVFNFGFLQYGIFWGWPSSHAAVAFAGAVALAALYKHPLPRAGALAYACFIGTGAAVGFHWFSDALAGAIVGSVVGLAAARGALART